MEQTNTNSQNAVKFKWCAILSSCFAIFIAYAKEWIKIPETIVSVLRMGNDFLDFSDYLSSDLLEVKDALLEGKLTLLQAHKGLSALGELMEGQDAADYSMLMKIFYALIILFLVMEAAEILWYFFDKRRIFVGSMISGTVLFAAIFWFVAKMNEEIGQQGEGTLSISMWAWVCLILPFASSFFWHQYRKYAAKTTRYVNTEMAATQEIGSAKPVVFSKEKILISSHKEGAKATEKTFKADWKGFIQKNGRVILFTIVVLFLQVILDGSGRTIIRNSTERFWIYKIEILTEAMVIGLAVVYARAKRYEYLVLYAIAGVVSNKIFYNIPESSYDMSYQISRIWYPVIIVVLLYLGEKFLQESKTKWYLMAGIVAVLKTLVITWLQVGEALINLNTILQFAGIFGVVCLYLYKMEVFQKATNCSDERLIRR